MAKLTSNALIVPGRHKEEGARTVLLFEAWSALYEPIEEVDGATVGTLVEILRGDPDFYARVLDCPNLEAFLDEPPGEPDDRPMRHVEFAMYVERWSGHKWNHAVGDLTIHVDVSGIGTASKDDVELGIAPGADVNFALDFTPLSSLVGLPIVIKDEVEIIEDKRISRTKYEHKREILGRYHIRLIDILYALVDEIGFHGSPEARSGILDDLKERVDEIKRGEANLIPFDDVKKKLDEDDEDDIA